MVGAEGDAAHGGDGIVERDLAAFDAALDAPFAIEDRMLRCGDGVVVDVADGDLVTGDGVGLGDAAAHDAAAEDADLLDVFEFHGIPPKVVSG